MAINIFSLMGSIMVDSEQANKSISKTSDNAKSLGDTFASGLKSAGKFAAGLTTAVAGAAVAAGAALKSAVDDAATYADEIDKASYRSSLGAENLQRLKYAAEQSGASLENIEKSAKKVNDRLGEITEGGSVGENAIAMFERLGVSVYDSAGEMRTTDDIYNETLLKLAEMGDTAEATSIGTDLFGKAFTDLKPLLAAGADGITNLTENADKLGIVMSQDSVNAGVKYGDTIADIKNALGGAVRSIGASVLPMFQKFADKIITYIPKIQKFIEKIIPVVEELAENIIDPIMEMMDDVFPDLLSFLETLIAPLTDIIKSILPVVIDLFKKIMPVIQRLIEKLLPPLVEIIDELTPIFDILLDLLSPILDLILDLIDPIADVLEMMTPVLKTIVNLIEKALKPLTGQLEDSAENVRDVFGVAMEFIADLISNVVIPALDYFTAFLNGDFMGALDGWGRAFTGVFDTVFETIDGIFGTHLADWYDDTKSFFMDVGSNIYELTHGQEIELQELNKKYSTMQADMYAAVKTAIYGGKTIEEAIEDARREVLTTSEQLYLYDQMADSWNVAEIAEQYYKNKDKPVRVVGTSMGGYTPGGMPTYTYDIPKYASGGMAYGDTLAVIGDNPDAAVNPEIVAPLKDLSQMIAAAFSRVMGDFADTLSDKISGAEKPAQALQISVRLSDDTELTRALIKNINDCTRQDGVCVIRGI